MTLRYFRRPWNETRGDAHDDWGTSIWYFEVGDDLFPLRQIERYERGPVLRYSSEHTEDEFGGLGDQALPVEEFAAFEISAEDFEAAWRTDSE